MKSAKSNINAKLAAGKESSENAAKVVRLHASSEKVVLPADVAAASEQQAIQTSQQAAMAALARLKSEVAQDQYGEFNCLALVGNRREVINIDSTAGGDYILDVFNSFTGKLPPKSQIDNIRSMLRTEARRAGNRMMVHQRIATRKGVRYVDLGDSEGRCIVIAGGSWHIDDDLDVAFVRGRGYGVLPLPIRPRDASAAYRILRDWLKNGLGVSQPLRGLVIVTLLAWLRTGNAYPVLLLYGSAGSGKTVAAKLIMMLIDPTESEKLPSIGMDTEHIAAAAQHRHILSFDNLSKLSAAHQDTLCTCATGGEIIGRRLYSNGDIAVLPIHRPVLMTAVQPVITRPDLMSRAIPVEFAPPANRRGEDEIMAEFMDLRPELLGALCELLASAGE
jgi:hypothetical protein